MADITGIFKSTVKMLKVRHKDLSSIKKSSGHGDDSTNTDQSSENGSRKLNSKQALNGTRKDSQFAKRARAIVENITSLRMFLVKNRKAYMAASSAIPLTGGGSKLSEEERDKIDADAMSYIKLCNETLAKYKAEVLHVHVSPQQKEHQMLAISMVEEYLKAVCELYSEQRAIRVKRTVDRQKMSRLELPPVGGTQHNDPTTVPSVDPKAKSEIPPATIQSTAAALDDFGADPTSNLEVTSEEAQLFQQENEQLYNEMNSTMEEVRQIEGKVVEISKLQAIFTEKVLEQEADISRIGDVMVHSTENVVQGNDDIREAMKNNAGMRVWIIFGICVLSFTLLFLDWYND